MSESPRPRTDRPSPPPVHLATDLLDPRSDTGRGAEPRSGWWRSSANPPSPPIRPARSWRFELVFGLVTLGAVSLILSLVGRHGGWPVGQAFGDYLLLTQIYAAHFRHLDVFPIWSSSDAYGLGTPVLLYYHRAFLSLAASLDLVLGSLKAALVVSLGVFFVIGAYGMRLALTVITPRRWLQALGALAFLFTNYAFTDWLVRGDLAEFSALMVVPWTLWWCMRLLTTHNVSLLFIPIMVLLVDSHSAIALLSLILFGVTGVVFLANARFAGLRAVIVRIVLCGAGVAILLAPQFLVELEFARFYDPATKVKDYSPIASGFVSFGSYFVDGGYHWFSAGNRAPLSVQLDFAIWVPLVVAVAAVALLVRRQGRAVPETLRGLVSLPVAAALTISLLVYMVLQLRATLFVYRAVPILQVIDYPYRMLAFVTPIGVALVVMFGEALLRLRPAPLAVKGLPAIWAASILALSPLTAAGSMHFAALGPPPAGDQVPLNFHNEFGVPTHWVYGDDLPAVGGTLFGEYLPRVVNSNGSEMNPVLPLYERLAHYHYLSHGLYGARCSIVEPANTPFESLTVQLTVTCDRQAAVFLPISYNGYSSIVRTGPGPDVAVPYRHLVTDPRMVITAPKGTETLRVSLPTFWKVIF